MSRYAGEWSLGQRTLQLATSGPFHYFWPPGTDAARARAKTCRKVIPGFETSHATAAWWRSAARVDAEHAPAARLAPQAEDVRQWQGEPLTGEAIWEWTPEAKFSR